MKTTASVACPFCDNGQISSIGDPSPEIKDEKTFSLGGVRIYSVSHSEPECEVFTRWKTDFLADPEAFIRRMAEKAIELWNKHPGLITFTPPSCPWNDPELAKERIAALQAMKDRN